MKYWIGVASEDHVGIGVSGGFAQLCHGKGAPLNRMKEGDWLIYYAPKKSLNTQVPSQRFVAIGQILAGDAYPFEMAPDFIPFRKNVAYVERVKTLPLTVVSDFPLWQEYRARLRFGHFEIPEELFTFISSQMIEK